jgi:hypothetical protein
MSYLIIIQRALELLGGIFSDLMKIYQPTMSIYSLGGVNNY